MEPIQPTTPAPTPVPVQPAGQSPLGGVQAPIPTKSSNLPVVLLSFTLILVCVVAGYFFYQFQTLKKEVLKPIVTQTPVFVPTPQPTLDPTADWKTYQKKDFSFKAPKRLEYNEQKSGDNLVLLNEALPQGKTPDKGIDISLGYLYGNGIVKCSSNSECFKYLDASYKVPRSDGSVVSEIDSQIQNSTVKGRKIVTPISSNNKLVLMELNYPLSYGGNYFEIKFSVFGKSEQEINQYLESFNLPLILSTFKFVGTAEKTKVTPTPSASGYFQGEVWKTVPYTGLKFKEINIANFSPLQGELSKSDYHYGQYVMDGYTFVAREGEDYEFVAEEDVNSNPGSFIKTELYGFGPTVIKMETRIGWGVPITGRYFYIVVGSDRYEPINDGGQYGKYTLKVTKRK